jgi:acetyl-CoA acyltransferase
MKNIVDAVIVAAARTPTGRAKRGGLATVRPEEMGAAAVSETLRRAPGLDAAEIDDLIMGCSFPEGEQGINIARIIGLRAGLPASVPAETVNRCCSSGLQSVAHAAFAIQTGQMQTVIAGGVESMTMVPMTGAEFLPSPYIAAHSPQVYTSMGLTAENLAEKYAIGRQDQDEFALRSHRRAAQAVESGLYDPEIVPMDVEIVEPAANGGHGPPTTRRSFTLRRDEGPRKDSSLEALAKLPPVFKEGGTVTAGNASPMSDGSACVLLMAEERARAHALKPLARFVAYAVAGVPPEIMGIGPVEAVPKALELAGLTLADIDLIELNEAFAVQTLAVIHQLGLDVEKVNVNGGAIALGHPLGATGSKLLIHLIYEMKRRKVRYGMVTMCIGGGQGAAGIFENIE